MERTNNQIEEVRKLIKDANDYAYKAYLSTDIGNGSYTKTTLENDAMYAKKNSENAYYYENKACNELCKIVDTYNKEAQELVNEINKIIEELNIQNKLNSNNNSSLKEKELIAKIREIDLYAGSKWYKEEGSKLAKPLRDQLSKLKAEKVLEEEKIKFEKEDRKSFYSTENELESAKGYSYEAEKLAKNAAYENEENDIIYELKKSEYETKKAHSLTDNAIYLFNKEADRLTNNLNSLRKIKLNFEKKLIILKKENNSTSNLNLIADKKNKLLELKAELQSIYDKAGTTWYKEEGSKEASKLREQIKLLEKKSK